MWVFSLQLAVQPPGVKQKNTSMNAALKCTKTFFLNFKASIISIFTTLYRMIVWKKCDNVKEGGCRDEPTGSYLNGESFTSLFSCSPHNLSMCGLFFCVFLPFWFFFSSLLPVWAEEDTVAVTLHDHHFLLPAHNKKRLVKTNSHCCWSTAGQIQFKPALSLSRRSAAG